MEQLQNLNDNTLVKIIASEIANMCKREFKESLKGFNPGDERLTYTPKEAAKVLGIGTNAIYTLLKDDDFNCKFKIGDKWYISKKGLEEWINRQINK